jgi:TatD DNase family protein
LRLIDSHAHLHDSAFDADRPQVLARARAAEVEGILCVGATDLVEGARKAVRLAADPGGDDAPVIWATVGVHPHDVGRMAEPDLEEIRALCAHPRVVAVGETGLDFYYDHSPREAQAAAFRRFARLAREVGKPLVVHVRDAHQEALEILDTEQVGEVGGQVHCFTGTPDDARRYLDLGMHVSFTGIVTFRKSELIQEAARRVPLDRLLVETDCPYLAPLPMRGKRNEPAFVRRVAEFLAELRGVPLAELAEATTRNARALFGLRDP